MNARKSMPKNSYWHSVGTRFNDSKLGRLGLFVLIVFICAGVYAPFLASSKPLAVIYENTFYFPLLRYYFSSYFFTKRLDLFFNVLSMAIPCMAIAYFIKKRMFRWGWLGSIGIVSLVCFVYFGICVTINPATNVEYHQGKNALMQQATFQAFQGEKLHYPNWAEEMKIMPAYMKLNLLIEEIRLKKQHVEILSHLSINQELSVESLWQTLENERLSQKKSLEEYLENNRKQYQEDLKKERNAFYCLNSMTEEGQLALGESLKVIQARRLTYESRECRLQYLVDKQKWIESEVVHIQKIVFPIVSVFHWEDDAAGSQYLNRNLPFYQSTRTNRKDLMAALLFGIRVSLFVGFVSVALSLFIGIPLGAIAGYFKGKTDLFLCRGMEIWEAMPAFFMLLLIIAIVQSKSLFIVISVIAVFSWVGVARFVRAETLKQASLSYVEAASTLGLSNYRIIFGHILPNALTPVVTLLPFDIMAAISREAGLSFLGLGEEGSCSWGVLMDEARAAFPGESTLLWPPAVALTILLVAIAFVGEALRRAMDPRSTTHFKL